VLQSPAGPTGEQEPIEGVGSGDKLEAVFEAFADGTAICSIARSLEAQGVTTRLGRTPHLHGHAILQHRYDCHALVRQCLKQAPVHPSGI
jgi:hypothetical protein